jgi:RimJ/RimL family protein N-acetyltransferase
MLKTICLTEATTLFSLMSHPDVYPYVRMKASCAEELMFILKQLIEEEQEGKTISRTITDEYGQIIGMISLYQIENGSGFLSTWLGKDFHGLGYNKQAKELFFDECFYTLGITRVFMKIRKSNVRSLKAAEKLFYVKKANDIFSEIYDHINKENPVFDLFVIEHDAYILSKQNTPVEIFETQKEA